MSATGWVSLIIVVIVVIVAGLLVFRSTVPNGDVAPTEESVVELQQTNGPDQFLQIQPQSTPANIPPETSPAATASPAASNQGATVISITDTGFSPAAVTVASGTTVTFVNNGQGLHWPASAVHPTHQELPGFDALRGLATGQEYSYTFDKVGTWKYHDHLNPNLTGSITVQ